MRILLTNDDGIYAPGLRALRLELLKLGTVTVVAPATEQSAAGHSVTLLNPLLVSEATTVIQQIEHNAFVMASTLTPEARASVLAQLHTQMTTMAPALITALKNNPTGSLRSIAAVAGASPETVRAVRASGHDATDAAGPNDRAVRAPKRWEADLALASSDDAGEFARWLDQTQVDDEWREYVWTIPFGRIYEIADEARRRAACWTQFASLLESRIQR